MAFNTRGTFTLDLSLFGSLVTDMAPTDLPPGGSPANSDCFYLPGGLFTRPALSRQLPSAISGNPELMSIEEFSKSGGTPLTVYLDSTGNIAYDNPLNPGTETIIDTVTSGGRFKAQIYDNKQWYAIYNQALSSAFTKNPLVGAEIPRYFDGSKMWRVTSDAPAGGLAFETINVSGANLVTGTFTNGPSISSAASSGARPFNTPPLFDASTGSYNAPSVTAYSTITIILYGAPSTPLAKGMLVQVYGINWGGSGPQWESGIPIAEVLSTNSFTIRYYSTTQFTGTGGTFNFTSSIDPSLFRSGNIVTTYLAGTSESTPTLIQPGWYVTIKDTEATAGSIPDGSVPNTTNELFQAMGGDFGSATLQGDGTGNIIVTTEQPIINLPIGSWFYYFTLPPPAGVPVSFDFPDANNVTITMAANPYVVGQQVQMVDCKVGSTPTFVGNPILTITAVTPTTFTAPYANNGGPQTLSEGSVIPVGTMYGFGYAKVTAVTGIRQFQFFLTGNGASVAATGVVYDIFGIQPNTSSGGQGIAQSFQVLSVNTNTGANPNSISWFQLGSDNAYTGTHTLEISPTTAMAAGRRNGVCIFESVNGALTAPSVPVTVVTNGGNNYLVAASIPIGPAGTAKRVIAFTPAGGSSYFYITPTSIPQVGDLAPLSSLGTVISDNTTVTQIFDFTDAALTAGTPIDVAGKNLFNQDNLAPCLGVIEYQGRLGWWGEISNVKNLVNMGFDGGYVPPSGTCAVVNGSASVTWESGQQFLSGWVVGTGEAADRSIIVIDGIGTRISSVDSSTGLTLIFSFTGASGTFPFYVLNPINTQPPGWDASHGDGYGSLVKTNPQNFGFSYQMVGGRNNLIQQSAYQDFYGATTFKPTLNYLIRFRASASTLNLSGQINFDVYSPGDGFAFSSSNVSISLFTMTPKWFVATLNAPMPPDIPPDTVFRVYLVGTSAGTVTIDELEVIYADRPIEYDRMMLSYYQNPFGYDLISGALQVDPSQSIAGAFRQRGSLYLIGGDGSQSLFQAQNNGTTEPNQWNVVEYATECGCSGPNAVDYGEELAWWGGRYGGRIFDGNPTTKKITQALSSLWEDINWGAKTGMWVKNDPVNRLLYFGIPVDGASSPNQILSMSYRLSDSTYNVPDEIHVSQYSGKLIDTDLARRWSPWQLALNCAAMCTRSVPSGGLARIILFGTGEAFGNFYTLDTENYPPLNPLASTWRAHDDDYGRINSFYVTYFFFPKDVEQNPILSLYRKIYNYLSVHLTGVGNMKITPYVDAMTKAAPALKLYQMAIQDTGFDIEWHPNVRGDRVAWRFEPIPVGDSIDAAMSITHMQVSGRTDRIFPLRGTVMAGV